MQNEDQSGAKLGDHTQARFWLEVLPGAAAVFGGLLLLVAANRLVTSFGGWLAVAGGAWFVVGPTLARLLHLGSPGAPIHTSTIGSTLETLLLFTGIGALILFFGTLAVGRLGVVSVRDVRSGQRREADTHDDADDHEDDRGGAGRDSGRRRYEPAANDVGRDEQRSVPPAPYAPAGRPLPMVSVGRNSPGGATCSPVRGYRTLCCQGAAVSSLGSS